LEANQRLKSVRSRFLSPLKPADREIFLDLMIELIEGNNSLGRAAWRFNAGSGA
jgi:hypothetical protein